VKGSKRGVDFDVLPEGWCASHTIREVTELLVETDAAQNEVTAPPATFSFGGSARLGVPFLLVHLTCIAAFFVGFSPIDLVFLVATYVPRIIGITVFYHRGLSHRAFTMRRLVRAGGAALGASAAQRGPLWWPAHHRIHHRYTDRPGDPHSPVTSSFLYSHVLWIFAPANHDTHLKEVPDLAAFKELRLMDRYHHVLPTLLAFATFGAGVGVSHLDHGLHTSGWQCLIWGFFISTVLLYHSTFAINSLAHRLGKRRFETKDASRNNGFLTFITLGEGWHNNHHRFPNSARQGMTFREPDPAWWVIRVLKALHLVDNLRPIPPQVWEEGGLRPRYSGTGKEKSA